jgi:hypothetical protein
VQAFSRDASCNRQCTSDYVEVYVDGSFILRGTVARARHPFSYFLLSSRNEQYTNGDGPFECELKVFVPDAPEVSCA